jgi:hypothetical protein
MQTAALVERPLAKLSPKIPGNGARRFPLMYFCPSFNCSEKIGEVLLILLSRFIQRDLPNLTRNRLQLTGVAAMLVASKYEEIYAPEVRCT